MNYDNQTFARLRLPNSSLLRILAGIQKSIERWDRMHQAAARVLIQKEWLMLPSARIGFYKEIAALDPNTTTRSDIYLLFRKEYFQKDCRRLKRMAERIVIAPNAKKRKHILENLIDVTVVAINHRIDPSNAMIPSILIQADGLFTDYLDRKRIPYKGNYKGKKATGESRSEVYNALPRPHSISKALHVHSMNFFFDIVLRNFNGRHGRPPKLNRHAIVHGYSRAYGNEPDLLRSISLLDFIAHLP